MTTSRDESVARPSEGGEPADSTATPPDEQRSQSVRALVHDALEPLPAGQVVSRLLQTHPQYVDVGLAPDNLGSVGAVRTAEQHVVAAAHLWDVTTSPYLTGRRVIIALAAEDPAIGGMLVLPGALASLIARWLPKDRTGLERTHVVWDLLSPAGREHADEQPLLAATLGAPAEWMTPVIGQAEQIAWAPIGNRIAVRVDTGVVQVSRLRTPQSVATLDRDGLGIAWGSRGPAVLQAGLNGSVEFRELTTGAVTPGPSGARGLLSGDATTAWIDSTSGWLSWSPPSTATQPLGVAGAPLAVDRSGRRGLVLDGGHLAVVDGSTRVGGTAPEATLTGPFAVGEILGQAVVASTGPGGVIIGSLGGPRLARIATGPDPVATIAFDPDGTAIAIGVRDRIEVWSLSVRRAGNRQVARFDSDQVGGPDLLSADADATALAGLIASAELRPPLTVGLFGAWGAGKSFVLAALERELRQLTGPDRPTGFLGGLRIVRFNAWHYAETNLWASLVDEVLRQLGDELPKPELTDLPQVQEAEAAAKAANSRVKQLTQEAQVAQERLASLRRPVRRWGIAIAAVLVVVVAAGAAVALLTGLSATVVAGYGAAVTALAAALGAVAEIRSRVEDLQKLGGGIGEAQAPFRRVVVMIDDLDRCPPDKVVSILEAVHLLLDFRSFVAVIAVDTRWLEQSIRVCHRDVLGNDGGVTPADYLEKIIQLPVHLRPLDDDTVRSMMAGLAGVVTPDAGKVARRPRDTTRTPAAAPAATDLLRGHEPRPVRPALPAESLQIGPNQLEAMAEVAALVGHTPRTVKRFVNTYRVLKATADNLDRFDDVRHGVGDHQVVAFLLAAAVGPHKRAGAVSTALAAARSGDTLEAALANVHDAELRTWLFGHRAFAAAPVTRFVPWSAEVFRYSFWPPHRS